MEEVKQDVTEASSTTTEPEVQTATPTPEGQTVPNPEGQTDTQVTEPVQKVEDDTYWKNRAMEYQRKLDETVQSIPKVIQETLAQQTPKQQEYTVEQLEVFADQTDDVQSKLWAKQKIRELERVEREKEYQRLVAAERTKLTSEHKRQAAEAEVINDPRFQEAFVEQGGRKAWNPQSKLTQMAASYLSDPALSERSDALPIAMKLAYADFVMEKNGKVAQTVTSVKRENAQLKQKTLVEGGGVSGQAPKVDKMSQAMTELSKTGSKSALRQLTQEILRQQGVIK